MATTTDAKKAKSIHLDGTERLTQKLAVIRAAVDVKNVLTRENMFEQSTVLENSIKLLVDELLDDIENGRHKFQGSVV